MDIKQAQEYFALGVLDGVVVSEGWGEGHEWQIEFTGRTGNASPVLEIKRGGVRRFKTLDAAISTCKEIGFRDVRVLLSQLS